MPRRNKVLFCSVLFCSVLLQKTRTHAHKLNAIRCSTWNQKNNCTYIFVFVISETYSTPTVIFTSKNLAGKDYKTGDVFKFTTIVSNIGDGYDSSTGNFTAPFTGVYMFTATLCAYSKKSMYAHLIAAGTTLAVTRHYNADAHGTCTSISGVAKLSKGETARVQAGGHGSYPGALYSDDVRWPSFSGMLVHL